MSHDKNYKAEKMASTISKLKALLNKTQAKRFDIPDRDGMSVRVSGYGTLTFQYSYRYHNKATRIALARYPDISIKHAQENIPELRQMLNAGIYSTVQMKREKQLKIPH